VQQQLQGSLLTPSHSRCPPHGTVASERKNYRALQLLMILTTEESGNSLFPVENPAEAKQSLSPLGPSKCSTTTRTTTTTKIPHSRIRLGGLGLYLEGHGWSYNHHIPSLSHHLYFFCEMGDHVISSSPFLGFIFRVS
jgi:hypothetical protein